ncbi:CBS domain-containing protein [Leptospira vanthielii]|uniref:CBS domain protein n=1 Tax=Leptospira vanthielii serovar Holland str. Waz Holland = ATCC 700522 TaxID=1218591 RepID=N1VZF0_9LEPT|nr:CBS domain-containing protein [Leptospira vanthielii]EMY69354.1 CBS domain protein [Leptospira vanthielii serovar Holland str. Waz Holland = ATCC 700522]
MNFDLFLVTLDSSIEQALVKIEGNHLGFILVQNETKQIIGLVTDGDIRRNLLNGKSLSSPISDGMNREFTWSSNQSPREQLLKMLDSRIRFIPILDENKRLVGIVTKDEIPILEERKVYARARSPVRISFGGGGSDLTHFFSSEKGAVINSTVSLYTHATLRIREDYKIILNSRDLKESIEFTDFDDLIKRESKFKLFQSIIKVARPNFGFELFVHSDYPMNSGLGGSAVVSSAILGCFNQFRKDKWDNHEIAELAFQAERLDMGIAGGWQDQYATVFGGFNFMEFAMDQNIVHPLRLSKDTMIELEESLILCDTATTHDSGNIHDDQRESMKQSDIKQKVQSTVELTYEMRNHLLRGRLLQFGLCLHKAWEIKRGLSSKISNQFLDKIYNDAIANGAIGGKLLGAGGGGFFLFYVPPFVRHKILNWMDSVGLNYRPFRFDSEGLQAWTVREELIKED